MKRAHYGTHSLQCSSAHFTPWFLKFLPILQPTKSEKSSLPKACLQDIIFLSNSKTCSPSTAAATCCNVPVHSLSIKKTMYGMVVSSLLVFVLSTIQTDPSLCTPPAPVSPSVTISISITISITCLSRSLPPSTLSPASSPLSPSGSLCLRQNWLVVVYEGCVPRQKVCSDWVISSFQLLELTVPRFGASELGSAMVQAWWFADSLRGGVRIDRDAFSSNQPAQIRGTEAEPQQIVAQRLLSCLQYHVP